MIDSSSPADLLDEEIAALMEQHGLGGWDASGRNKRCKTCFDPWQCRVYRLAARAQRRPAA